MTISQRHRFFGESNLNFPALIPSGRTRFGVCLNFYRPVEVSGLIILDDDDGEADGESKDGPGLGVGSGCAAAAALGDEEKSADSAFSSDYRSSVSQVGQHSDSDDGGGCGGGQSNQRNKRSPATVATASVTGNGRNGGSNGSGGSNGGGGSRRHQRQRSTNGAMAPSGATAVPSSSGGAVGAKSGTRSLRRRRLQTEQRISQAGQAHLFYLSDLFSMNLELYPVDKED